MVPAINSPRSSLSIKINTRCLPCNLSNETSRRIQEEAKHTIESAFLDVIYENFIPFYGLPIEKTIE